MEMLYTSQGIYNFLDVDIGERKIIENSGLMYKIRMLEKNHIPYLISPYENEIDGKFYLRYNTDSNYVLERLLLKIKPDGNFLKLVITQLFECINESVCYLLNPNDIVLDPSYMFFNHTAKRLGLVCVPGYEKSINGQLKELLEYFMRIFDHRDQEGVRYLYGIYDRVTEENFSICECGRLQAATIFAFSDGKADSENLLNRAGFLPTEKREESKKQEEATKTKSETGGTYTDKSFEFTDDEEEKSYVAYACIAVAFVLAFAFCVKYFFFGGGLIWLFLGIVSFFASAVMLLLAFEREKDGKEIYESMMAYKMEGGKQGVFGMADANPSIQGETDRSVAEGAADYDLPRNSVKNSGKDSGTYRLVPLNNGCLEPLHIKNQTITVGRGKKENDYRLSGSQISRVHAHIYKRENDLYLKDEGSTNGTFVNSVRLSANEERKLNRGDVVAFATEEFFVS
jgi:hypothetical protein